jgi:TIR domain
MDIITGAYLDNISSRLTFSDEQNFTQKRTRITEARVQGRVTAFLSHSHSDKERIKPIIKILNSVGVDIYVDWLDNEMPTSTSGKTAETIKAKIKSNKKFILLASNIAIKSNWVNWELGIGDGAKYIDNMMILPFKENHQNWTNNEYFEIYPHLESENQYDYQTGQSVTYYVIYPDKTKLKLQDWLKR